ncbi:glycosyltransferase [Cognatiyoonia sp.]|uniref:glycosyltransferase n=1 Tax=Cognatiyoonia sp. TaxID=2211652 RepID=UPI003F6994A5
MRQSVEVIITTYNSTRALHLTLIALEQQSMQPDVLCIADDGSGPETKALIDEWAARLPYPVRHVWHEDNGFEKCRILNSAIESSAAEFLIFLDGDVLIHPDFIKRHYDLRQRGRYSTGSLIRLDDQTTKDLTEDVITDGSVFQREWLWQNRAIDRLGTWLKTMPFPFCVQDMFDRITPVKKALCGANWSAFREDILAVNGFDETMKYGGLDKELGFRLQNAGIVGRHLRYTAPLVHQDHPRGYKDREKVRRHKEMIQEVRDSGRSWTKHGIIKADASAI